MKATFGEASRQIGNMDDMVLIFVLSLEDTTVTITHTSANRFAWGHRGDWPKFYRNGSKINKW